MTSHIIHISGNMKEVFLLEAFSPGQGKAAPWWLSNTLTHTTHVKIVHFHSRAGSWSRRRSGFKAVGYCDSILSIASFALFCTRRSVDFFPQNYDQLASLYKARSPPWSSQPSRSVWASEQRRRYLCFSTPTLNI